MTGTTMMFVTWAIVPLQSAIFSTGTVTRTRETPMTITGSLMPLEEQTAALNSQFLNTAYGVSWLGQKPPPYTTKEYALLPFSPVAGVPAYSGSDTWTSSTLAYYTNLTCTPAIIKQGVVKKNFIFEDGNGCVTEDIAFPGASPQFLVMYIPYFDDPNTDWALQNPKCTVEHSHNFLAIWGESQSIDDNISAQFCRPTYYIQPVTATVNVTNHAVINIDYIDAPDMDMKLPEADFNITNFEYVIGTGSSQYQVNRPLAGDLPDVSIIEQLPRLINYSLAWPLENMVGYGMAASSGQAKDLADPLQMHKAFESAHKLLFSMAVAALTTTERPSINGSFGLITDQPASIIFVRSFSIIVEVFLAAVCVLTCVLWVIYQQRQTNMTHDPASISDIMRLVYSSKEPLHGFDDSGTLTTQLLKERLHGHRYRLVTYYKNGSAEMHLETLETGAEGVDKSATSHTTIDCPEQFQAVRPFELTFITGGMIGAVIIAAIAILSFLYRRILQFNGN
jgi:hypothetical protein